MATNRASRALTAEELVAAVLWGARRVDGCFARHPEPIDGPVKASFGVAEQIRK
jgi:hypothetical protein